MNDRDERLAGRLRLAREKLHPSSNLPNDIVIALVKKSKRTGVEIRLRDLRPVGRVVLLRLMNQDDSGIWWPTADSAYSGLTIRADLLTRVVDALEEAEDKLDGEGALP